MIKMVVVLTFVRQMHIRMGIFFSGFFIFLRDYIGQALNLGMLQDPYL